MIFILQYRPRPDRNYDFFDSLLTSLGRAFRLADAAWLLSSDKSRGEVFAALNPSLGSEAAFFVAPLNQSQYLPGSAREWVATEKGHAASQHKCH